MAMVLICQTLVLEIDHLFLGFLKSLSHPLSDWQVMELHCDIIFPFFFSHFFIQANKIILLIAVCM